MSTTEPGKAVLFIHTKSGMTFAEEFLEGDSDRDPQLRAELLWEGIKDDFPGALSAIALNDRARDLMANRRMAEMGFTDYDHAAVNER